MLTLLLRAVPEVLCQPCRTKVALKVFLLHFCVTTHTTGRQRGILQRCKHATHISVQIWSCHCMLMLEQQTPTREADIIPVEEGVEAVVNVRDIVLNVDLRVKRTFRLFISCKVCPMEGTYQI